MALHGEQILDRRSWIETCNRPFSMVILYPSFNQPFRFVGLTHLKSNSLRSLCATQVRPTRHYGLF